MIREERLKCQWFKHLGGCVEAQRVSTAFLRLQLVLEEVRKEANPVWGGIVSVLTPVNSAVLTPLPGKCQNTHT